MTAADQKLLDKAKSLTRWEYRRIDDLLPLAESDEAYERLSYLQKDMYDLCMDSL